MTISGSTVLEFCMQLQFGNPKLPMFLRVQLPKEKKKHIYISRSTLTTGERPSIVDNDNIRKGIINDIYIYIPIVWYNYTHIIIIIITESSPQ